MPLSLRAARPAISNRRHYQYAYFHAGSFEINDHNGAKYRWKWRHHRHVSEAWWPSMPKRLVRAISNDTGLHMKAIDSPRDIFRPSNRGQHLFVPGRQQIYRSLAGGDGICANAWRAPSSWWRDGRSFNCSFPREDLLADATPESSKLSQRGISTSKPSCHYTTERRRCPIRSPILNIMAAALGHVTLRGGCDAIIEMKYLFHSADDGDNVDISANSAPRHAWRYLRPRLPATRELRGISALHIDAACGLGDID